MIVKLLLTIIILSVEATQDKNASLISHLESKKSFFYKINSNIHNAVNTIFSCLKLLKYFSKSDLNEMMLQIHNKFLNKAEQNYIAYEQLKNASNTNLTMGDYKRKFLESLNEIVKEETIKHKHARNETLNNAQNNTVTEKRDESLEFLDQFVDKFSKMTLENLTNHEINEPKYKNGIVKLLIRSKNYELKAWNSTFLNGTPNNLTRRLYRGRNTRIKNYPFLVSIHVLNDFMCSGSIISKDLVITAASCLQIAYNNSLNPQSVFVRVGSDYTKSYGQLIPITDVFFHPQYNPQILRNNIVIIRIKSQLNLVSKKGKIRRIQYNKRTEKQTNGVYVLGWGALESRHSPKNFQKLAVDYLDIYNFNDCQDIYTRNYVKDHQNFCAGFVDKGAGACNRDVGGPGFRDGLLIGIISFGPPVCGMPNSPTVFTNIGHYATWIDSIVHQKPVFKISKPTTQQARTTNEQMARSRRISMKLLYTTPFSTARTRKVNEDYPDEVKVLNEMLQEIVLANSSIIDYILQSAEQAPDATKTYNNKNDINVENQRYFQDFTRTTGRYHSRKHTITTTKNDMTNMLRIGDYNGDQVYDINDERQPHINAHTPADDVQNDEELDIVYSNEHKSSDVSENYEEHPPREHEITIDTNNFALNNVSFLDVLFNLKQYQESFFPKPQAGDKKETDPINLKFFLGSKVGIDTTPSYLDERSTQIGEIEPETEEKSISDDDKNDGKLIREDNKNNILYSIVDPWQLGYKQKSKDKSIQSNQNEFLKQGKGSQPQQMNFFYPG